MRTIYSSYVELDPTNFEYVESFDSQPEPGSYIGEGATFTMPDGSEVDGTNWLNAHDSWLKWLLRKSPDSIYDNSGQCDHCGAHLRYVVVMKYKPTAQFMAIGETCFTERFDYDDKVTKDLDRLRKLAAAGRERSKVKAAHEAWLAESEANRSAEAFLVERKEAGDSGFGGFYSDVLRKLNQYGFLTERQVEAVNKAKVRDAEFAARKAAEAAAPPADPCPSGKQTVVGTVLSTRWVDSEWGGGVKMTVKSDVGAWRVWGTCPSKLTVHRGDKVSFSATITVSDDDPTFGFFKRPTKGVVLEVAEPG